VIVTAPEGATRKSVNVKEQSVDGAGRGGVPRAASPDDIENTVLKGYLKENSVVDAELQRLQRCAVRYVTQHV